MSGNMYIKIWGVRGSLPVPGRSTVRYGGNTSCLEVYNDDGGRILLDAGTGIRSFGMSLDFSVKHNIDIFISHSHWDHINGLLFFPLIFMRGHTITVYGPRTYEYSLDEILRGQMQYSYFPVRMEELDSRLNAIELKENTPFDFAGFHISTLRLNHPVECLGYRIEYNGKAFIYLPDNEPYYNIYGNDDPDMDNFVKEMNSNVIKFAYNADCLIADAQYLPSEYEAKKGWGHSSTYHVVNMALKARIKHVLFSHHDPTRTDDEIDIIVKHYQDIVSKKGYGLMVDAAAEGSIIKL
jgi:ribonuclease BN (tRNA processing enzyme)